jgi:dipeptidyl-peptidase-4
MRKLFLLTIIIMLYNCQQNKEKLSDFNTGTKEIKLEQVWDGPFSPQIMNSLNSMNGDFYSLLNYDREICNLR